MINPLLNKELPTLPTGYRWKYIRSTNAYSARGYIPYLYIQQKRWWGWKCVASEIHSENYETVPGLAEKVFFDYFGEQGSNKYLGYSEENHADH